MQVTAPPIPILLPTCQGREGEEGVRRVGNEGVKLSLGRKKRWRVGREVF